jgi:hypothetical protein
VGVVSIRFPKQGRQATPLRNRFDLGSCYDIGMGCCGSSEKVAPESDLPPPEWGKPVTVKMKKKGMFSSDYNVYTEGTEEPWMLVDAVGSMWDSGYSYYLKHRSAGQVDDEGKPASSVLGAVNIQGDWDAFSFRISGADRDVDVGLFYDSWDGDVDWACRVRKSCGPCGPSPSVR